MRRALCLRPYSTNIPLPFPQRALGALATRATPSRPRAAVWCAPALLLFFFAGETLLRPSSSSYVTPAQHLSRPCAGGQPATATAVELNHRWSSRVESTPTLDVGRHQRSVNRLLRSTAPELRFTAAAPSSTPDRRRSPSHHCSPTPRRPQVSSVSPSLSLSFSSLHAISTVLEHRRLLRKPRATASRRPQDWRAVTCGGLPGACVQISVLKLQVAPPHSILPSSPVLLSAQYAAAGCAATEEQISKLCEFKTIPCF
jgi:hypothetical protein